MVIAVFLVTITDIEKAKQTGPVYFAAILGHIKALIMPIALFWGERGHFIVQKKSPPSGGPYSMGNYRSSNAKALMYLGISFEVLRDRLARDIFNIEPF